MNLAERLAGSGVRRPATDVEADAGGPAAARVAHEVGAPADRPAGPPRHCWVTGLPATPGPCPGVLTAWVQESRSWLGRVVYATVEDGRVVLVEAWLDARFLSAADPSG